MKLRLESVSGTANWWPPVLPIAALIAFGLLLPEVARSQGAHTDDNAAQTIGLVEFLHRLVDENQEVFEGQRLAMYEMLCSRHGLDPEGRENRMRFFVLSFLHQLFTCRAPVNCERSGILEIPYMWHWIDPNPRHDIRRKKSGDRLADERPPRRFSRYQSLADVDRVPSIYLADLVTVEPQYEHPECGPMYTFGWCSEREMSFCLLAGLFGYEGRVLQSGNHVWSVFPVEWRTLNGGQKQLLLEFDSTYDIFGGEELPSGVPFQQWWQGQERTHEQRWYNARARDPEEIRRVRQIQVPPEAQRRIESFVRSALQDRSQGH